MGLIFLQIRINRDGIRMYYQQQLRQQRVQLQQVQTMAADEAGRLCIFCIGRAAS